MTKNKLRIAIFFSSDPASPGGVQEHIYYLSTALKNLGHRVTVFMPNRSNILLPYPSPKKVGEFSEFSTPIGYDISYISKKEGEDYNKIISAGKYDLIHIHDPFMPFLTYELLKVLELPIVTTYHATWEDDSILDIFKGIIPLLKDALSKKVKGSIFVSRRTKNCWDEVFHPKTHKTIIANGIDRSLFRFASKKNTGKTELLFVARIVPKKGLHVLLQALKKIVVSRKNVHLTVVGEGPDKKRMMEYVEKNNLDKFVEFTGYVEKEKKAEYFRKADIFCAPYVNEGFGITLLEAMATGTPIVALKNNAFSEVLRDYPEKSLIVTEKSAGNLANAIEKVIRDGKMRQKIVKWEKEEIKKYDWKKIAKETERFYYKVLSRT